MKTIRLVSCLKRTAALGGVKRASCMVGRVRLGPADRTRSLQARAGQVLPECSRRAAAIGAIRCRPMLDIPPSDAVDSILRLRTGLIPRKPRTLKIQRARKEPV